MSGVVMSCGGRLIRVVRPSLRIDNPCETITLFKRITLDEDKAGLHAG
jgi:hypothetical protein